MALTVTPTDEMKTLTVGNKIYEVVDDEARTELTDVKADLNEKLSSYTDCPFSVNNYRINPSNGVASYTNNQNITDWIPCEEGQEVKVHSRTTWYQGEQLNAIIAFYDARKQLIVAYDRFSDTESSNTTGTMVKVVPANTAYFRAGSQVMEGQYAHLYNIEDKINASDVMAKKCAIDNEAIQLAVGEIVVSANIAHSSGQDQIAVNIHSGTWFTVAVTSSVTSTQIYAYHSDGTDSRLVIGKYYTGKAVKDIDWIGIYYTADSAVTSEIMTVTVYTASGIYGTNRQGLPYKESLSQIVCNTMPANPALYGLETAYAEKMYIAIQDWMGYYAGDYEKIPFILHTDQHGRLTNTKKGLFDFLSTVVQWGNISAIFNLGDTVVDHWEDNSLFTNPLLINDTLEEASKCLESVPKDKQINVYGNHDTWYSGNVQTAVAGVLPSLQYLNPYFRATGLRAKPFPDNSGFQVVYDDIFNIKYLVLGCWDYADKTGDYTGYQWYWINQKHLEYVVTEMAKDDGYDLVLVSHVPLEMGSSGSIDPVSGEPYELDPVIYITHYDSFLVPLWNARKNRTSGSVSSGGVSVSFDFTNCKTDCLCAIAGHTHHDGATYIGNDGLLQIAFDYFTDMTIHFGVIDRANKKVKCWKLSYSNPTDVWEMPFDK